jgi:hypothetical protein
LPIICLACSTNVHWGKYGESASSLSAFERFLIERLVAEVNKDPAKIAVVFFKAVIESANMRLVEKSKHMFFELATAFARNNLDQCDSLRDCFLDNSVQLYINLIAAVVNIVQIQHEFCHQDSILSHHYAHSYTPQIECALGQILPLILFER